jgi:hypothetical protein
MKNPQITEQEEIICEQILNNSQDMFQKLKDDELCFCFQCGEILTGKGIKNSEHIVPVESIKQILCPECGLDSIVPEQCIPDTITFKRAHEVMSFIYMFGW